MSVQPCSRKASETVALARNRSLEIFEDMSCDQPLHSQPIFRQNNCHTGTCIVVIALLQE